MAYAIFKTGGKQYRVSEGDSIDVENIDVEVGESTSALVYILSSVAVSIAAVFLGLWVARAVFS